MNRICYACDSDKTSFTGRNKQFPNWYVNKPTNYVLCALCYNKIFRRDYKQKVSKAVIHHRKRKFRFKNQIIYADDETRINVCNWCRAVVPFDTNHTALHHDDDRYDESDPLKYTIEICFSCHGKETHRLGQMDPRCYRRD